MPSTMPSNQIVGPIPSGDGGVDGDGQSELRRPPRQPTSLQGLLRFAMHTTKMEDAPGESSTLRNFQPMDQERKKFLEEALKSMTVDVIEVLQKQIRVLRTVESVKLGDDITEYEQALETILDYVDHIDTANDFHKIGGFMVLFPCIKCTHPQLRAGACELIQVLCQNNPYCQQVVLDNGFVPFLLKMLDSDPFVEVTVKALSALSAIVRSNTDGFNQLIQYNGLPILLKNLDQKDEKIVRKTAFLLDALCRIHPDLKSRLVFLDCLPVLITVISRPRVPSHENVLSLLVNIVEENPTALSECKHEKYHLKDILTSYVNAVRNKEECLEEEQYCKRMIHMLQTEG